MADEVLLVYAGSSTNKRLDKYGYLIVTYKVKLQDKKKRFNLTISDGSPSLLAQYPEGCELPVQLNRTQQQKLQLEAPAQ